MRFPVRLRNEICELFGKCMVMSENLKELRVLNDAMGDPNDQSRYM
jgi:hypothetical protein